MLVGFVIAASAVCCVFPAVLFCINLRRYKPPAAASFVNPCTVSVLIPARNEEGNIEAALRCVLASRGVGVEVLVLDDDSADRTGEIVREMAMQDARVRLIQGGRLPTGWNGKQHACWVLAQHAKHGLLVFLDADVRVEPDLLIRMAAFREGAGASLVSGFPRLITITWLEQLLLPLIHFVLLGFLPMRAMRKHASSSFAAGCGQFLMLEREAYFRSGGHAAIRETMHDGLLLPRVLRRAGYRTDLADITALASVRMYDSTVKVWQGLAKNATEGIASVGKIVPLSLLLILGQVVPVILAFAVLVTTLLLLSLHLCGVATFYFFLRHRLSALAYLYLLSHGAFLLRPSFAIVAVASSSLALCLLLLAYLPRLLAVHRFKHPLWSALLHPIGVLALLAVQWYALGRKLFGRPVGWRQREYSSETGTQVG